MRLNHPARAQGKKIVVVVGGGFGGLNTALSLADKPDVFVILIDQRNHHLFQPLLYQVATAGLSPGDIAVPIRAEFADVANVEVHWGTVSKIDLERRYIAGADIEIEYDFLVLACGAQHSYFGHPEWEPFAPGLKTLEQATEIRRRILSAFEEAENELDPERQKALLNFVVVGGGATGVELAGAIADISRTVLVNDFKRIDPERARVILIEAGPRLMAAFDPELSERTYHDLATLGVEIRLSSRVENIDATGVRVGDDFIPSASVFWGAGVAARTMDYEPAGSVALDRSGRVIVGSDLSVAGHPNVFAIGDMAAVPWLKGGAAAVSSADAVRALGGAPAGGRPPASSAGGGSGAGSNGGSSAGGGASAGGAGDGATVSAKAASAGVSLVPGLAPAAIQEGKHVAETILATIANKPRKVFKYNDKGMMATIGKHRAVLQVGSFKMGGYVAWLAWLFVHIFYLIGFRNRIAVMTNWAWNYMFSKRGARLITDSDWKLKAQPRVPSASTSIATDAAAKA